jgi:hypothetical protein
VLDALKSPNESHRDAKEHYTQAVLAEYNSMRNEVIKRIELRYQIINLSLVISGVLFTTGFNSKQASVFLIYPFISSLLFSLWLHNGNAIMVIGTYLRDKIEIEFFDRKGPAWEIGVGERAQKTTPSIWWSSDRSDVFFSGGIFLVTQLVAIYLGWSFYSSSVAETVLFVLDAVAMALTFAGIVGHRVALGEHLQTAAKRSGSAR